MATPKLSIIVPIYNVEPYLRKCVESLLTQDLDPAEYEIILVDDGSPDGCPAICDEYAALSETNHQSRMPHIIAIHQENGGLSAARNTGIMAAKGKYVQFVDSDDYLQPNVLCELVEQMERENLDVLRFDYQIVHENGSAFWPIKTPKKYDQEGIVVDGSVYLEEHMPSQNYAWQFMVRYSIALKEQFPVGRNYEDIDWTPRMLWASRRVMYTCTIVYNYLWRQGTISRTKDPAKLEKSLQDTIANLHSQCEYLHLHPQSQWLQRTIAISVVSILTSVTEHQYANRRQYVDMLKSLCLFPLHSEGLSVTTRKRVWIINFLSPSIFCVLYHYRMRFK